METNGEHFKIPHGLPGPHAATHDPSCAAGAGCAAWCRHHASYRIPGSYPTCDASWLAAPYGQPLDRNIPWWPPSVDPNPL